MLFGDFLLTANLQRAGLRKKVHRLQPNLVVGWTGNLVAAEHVLTRLQDRFREEVPTKRGLEGFLEAFPTQDLGAHAATLIGWIIDNQPHCFLWRSDWGQTVFYENHHLQGSGAALFRQLTGIGTVPQTTDPPGPIQRALSFTCQLMADEIGERVNQAAGFGHAYELLHLDDGAFSYVDAVLYLFVDVPFDREGRYMMPKLHRTLYKSDHIGDHTLVQISKFREDGHHELDRYLTTPAYAVAASETDEIMKRISSLQYPFSLESKYSCLFARLIKDADTAAPQPLLPLIMIASSDERPAPFTVKWEVPDPRRPTVGSLNVQLPSREVFEIVYRDQVASE
jgi:hypothetical protein